MGPHPPRPASVWLVVGGQPVGAFADVGLLDEVHLGVHPVLLGAGAPLLPRRLTSRDLTLQLVEHRGQAVNLVYTALDAGLTSAYPHLAQYVFSRTLGDVDDSTVTVVAEDAAPFVHELKRQDGLGIWLCDGSILAGQLLPEIDELILKVNPVAIGTGRTLFARPFSPHTFTLTTTETYDSGVAAMRYHR